MLNFNFNFQCSKGINKFSFRKNAFTTLKKIILRPTNISFQKKYFMLFCHLSKSKQKKPLFNIPKELYLMIGFSSSCFVSAQWPQKYSSVLKEEKTRVFLLLFKRWLIKAGFLSPYNNFIVRGCVSIGSKKNHL